MNAEQFTYWLQGYVELNGNPPSPEQWFLIKKHLGLVFNKVTPELPVKGQEIPADLYCGGEGTGKSAIADAMATLGLSEKEYKITSSLVC